MELQVTTPKKRFISDETLLSLKEVDSFPIKTAKAKAILQKAKLPERKLR